MKKSVVIFITAVCLLITGCGDTGSLSKLPSSSFHEDKQKLTIMHIDADNKRFQDFIEETEKKLDMEITVEKCPSNADNRQAKISTILASGDKNIDLISVNDEMISEFKHKGYLEPLEKNVMTEEVRDSFPQKYLESICEENGHIYSVPFQMDIMMFWVNQELLKQAGLDEIKNTGDFDILQKSLKNPDQYAYGDAWENTHVYNSLSQFVNFWGGDYFDWTDPKTKDAARYMKISMSRWKRNLSGENMDVFLCIRVLWVHFLMLMYMGKIKYIWHRFPCFIRKKPLILQPGSMF